MTQAPIVRVKNNPVRRETYGLGADKNKDFRGMGTVPFSGIGQQLVENMQLDSGFYRKMYGNSIDKEIDSSAEFVNNVWEYQKTDNTFQKVITMRRDVGLLALTWTNGSTAVTSISGSFTTSLRVGQEIYSGLDGQQFKGVVASITDDDNLVLEDPYTGTSHQELSYGIRYQFRAVAEDGTIVTPSGGAGDVNFIKSTFDWVQIGVTGYLINKDTEANGNMWSWNGTQLTAVTNCPDNPEFLSRDGQRLVVGAEGIASFSQKSTAAITSFTGGTGANQSGNYNVANAGTPRGALPVNGGIVICFSRGAEFHKVLPNNDNTDLKGETLITSWNYTGNGISNSKQIVASENSIFLFNEDGLIQIDSYTGQSVNLIEDSGAIRQYWDTLDKDSVVMEYSPREKMVVMTVKNTGEARNDRLLCLHVPYSAGGRRVFYFKTNISVMSLGVVNNQLYGGSESTGDLIKIFDQTAYVDEDENEITARIINEWDGLGNPRAEKRVQDVSVFAGLHPDSSYDIDMYVDGSATESRAIRTTTNDATNNSSVIELEGLYVWGIGKPDEDTLTPVVKTRAYNDKFGTYTTEITETSAEDFRVYSIGVQFTPVATQGGGKQFLDQSYANVLR